MVDLFNKKKPVLTNRSDSLRVAPASFPRSSVSSTPISKLSSSPSAGTPVGVPRVIAGLDRPHQLYRSCYWMPWSLPHHYGDEGHRQARAHRWHGHISKQNGPRSRLALATAHSNCCGAQDVIVRVFHSASLPSCLP